MEIDIGKRIQYFRTSKGFSVNYLANQAGVSQSYLRELELGNYSNPTVDILEQICLVLGISLKEFFDTQAEINDIEDTLLLEIAKLTPSQKEYLRLFINSMK